MSSHLYLTRRSYLCTAMCECEVVGAVTLSLSPTHKHSYKTVPFLTSESTLQQIHYHTDLIQKLTNKSQTLQRLRVDIARTQHYVYTHGSHSYGRPRQSLTLFMATPELGFKYIFHATLPPMAANEEKKGVGGGD